MPSGDKDKYTAKQKRKAEHIAEGYEDRGVSKKEAKSRAWATVNKESGGGKKSVAAAAKKRVMNRVAKLERRAVRNNGNLGDSSIHRNESKARHKEVRHANQ
jgi:plasmid stabilization system protein ParE